jgi:SNF2 family DNA or RNA helicase
VPSGLAATLRDYQVRGYRWLETLRRNKLGGILADDMGLGKTLQVIGMMLAAQEDAAEQGEEGLPARVAPFLVVAPTSVVGNWVREIERFAPGLRARAVTETSKKRRSSLAGAVAGADVVVTSYTLFRLDIEEYHALNWSAAVFDEAQMIKNHTSRAYAAARVLDTPVKIAVTGTPLENNLLELWALASLVCPGLLGSKAHFTEFFRHPVEKQGDTQRLALLQRRLRPFLLRRTKDMVAADLPAKTEKVLELQLSPTHRRIYDVRLQRERAKVLGLVQDLDANRFEVFRSLTLLRQLALDSELAGEAPTPSAKLSALAELLTTVTQEGHKVLVLSQFTRFLRKARDAATSAGIDSLYLDGATRNRQQVIDAFRGEGDGDDAAGGGAPVFFISLKAGGFGLNLTEADYVVLLDPWWNPATEAQAVDRAHRIGQTRPVVVYRLVSANTIESKVMALKETKAALFDRVLDGGGAEVDGDMAGGAADRAAVGGGDIGRALDAADIRELLA